MKSLVSILTTGAGGINRCLHCIIALIAIANVGSYAHIVQKGVVKEYNVGQKIPLSGVTIAVLSADTVVSDDAGMFYLSFSDRKSGDAITYLNINKPGYVILNEEALDMWILDPNTSYDIVMINANKLKSIRRDYAHRAMEYYKEQYFNQIAKLKELKHSSGITDDEYHDRLKKIHEEYDRLINNLDKSNNSFDRFVRIDVSDLQDEEQAIVELIGQGDFDEALARYDQMDITGKITSMISKDGSKSKKTKKLSESDFLTLNSLYESLYRNIDALLLAGGAENLHKAISRLSEIADMDTGNRALQKKAASIYLEISDYDNAIKYYDRNLNLAIAEYGDQHPVVAESYNLKGIAYFGGDDYSTAIDNFAISAEIWEKAYGEEYPGLDRVYNSVGYIYYIGGGFDKALECFNKALDIRVNLYGREHSLVTESLDNIGTILTKQGEIENALKYFSTALDIKKRIYGEDCPEVANAYNNLGNIYHQLQEYQTARDYYNKAMGVRIMTNGDRHPEIATLNNNIGVSYGTQGDFFMGKVYLNRALDTYKDTYGEEHSNIADIYNNFGDAYTAQEEYSNAIENYEKTLNILLEINGKNDSKVADTYNSIGTVYFDQGDFPKAIDSFSTALSIRRSLFGEEHPDVATSYNNIGFAQSQSGNYSEGIDNLKKALGIRTKIYGDNHPDVERLFINLYLAYSSDDQFAEELGSFMTDKLIKASIAEDSPAAKQGLSGEYYVLEFDIWNISTGGNLFKVNGELKGKPKDLVLAKDGVVSKHHFDDTIGADMMIKKVDNDETSSVRLLYEQWKSSQTSNQSR